MSLFPLLSLSLAPALLLLCALRPSAKRWRRFPINEPRIRTPLFGGPTTPSSEISSSSRGRLAVLLK